MDEPISTYLHPFVSLVPEISFSKSNVSFMKNFLTRIHKNNLLWKKQKIIELSPSQEHPLDYSSIPSSIRENIEQKCTHQKCYKIEWKQRTFFIHFSFDRVYSLSEIRKMVQRIFIWLVMVVQSASSPPCSPILHIYFYLTDMKKELPKQSNEIVHEHHVNTAFTYACSSVHDKSVIYIFRKEEWFRAFIHETFHHFGLDFLRLDQTESIKRIQETFHLSHIKDIRVYETYCEVWAEMIQILFYVSFSSPSRKNTGNSTRKHKTNTMNNVYKWLKYERLFSLFQCTKVLKFHHIDYFSLLDNASIGQRYKEDTQAFCYYILKCILMVHIDSFLEFCDRNIQFTLTQENLKKYTELILSLARSDRMREGIGMAEKNKILDSGFQSTLRMSSLEFS
jgi:hypothetical protein